jgi:hypothetical protein
MFGAVALLSGVIQLRATILIREFFIRRLGAEDERMNRTGVQRQHDGARAAIVRTT